MIRFSALLVAVALGLLVAGVVTSKLVLVYIAIGVSGVALLALGAGALLKRNELFGQPEATGLTSAEPALGHAGPAAVPPGTQAAARDATVPAAAARQAAQSAPSRAGYLPTEQPPRSQQAAFTPRPPAGPPSPAPGAPVPVTWEWRTDAPATQPLRELRRPAPAEPPQAAGPSPAAQGQPPAQDQPPTVRLEPAASPAQDQPAADDVPPAPDELPAQDGHPAEPGPAQPSGALEPPAERKTNQPPADDQPTPGDQPQDEPSAADQQTQQLPAGANTVSPLAPAASEPAPEPAGPVPAAPEPAAAPVDLEREVTVVPGVPRYHNPHCLLIRFMGEGDLDKMTLGAARKMGCTPCRACLPDQPEAHPELPAGPSREPQARPSQNVRPRSSSTCSRASRASGPGP